MVTGFTLAAGHSWFTATGSCQSGSWASGLLVKYGGSFLTGSGYYGSCVSANIRTGSCGCPAGYTAKQGSMGGWYSYSAWDSFLQGYLCEK